MVKSWNKICIGPRSRNGSKGVRQQEDDHMSIVNREAHIVILLELPWSDKGIIHTK